MAGPNKGGNDGRRVLSAPLDEGEKKSFDVPGPKDDDGATHSIESIFLPFPPILSSYFLLLPFLPVLVERLIDWRKCVGRKQVELSVPGTENSLIDEQTSSNLTECKVLI